MTEASSSRSTPLAGVLTGAAVMIADSGSGGVLSGLAVLCDQDELLGPIASDPPRVVHQPTRVDPD